MANTPTAKKRTRQAARRRQANQAQRSMMRTAVKKVLRALDSGDQEKAGEAYRQAVPLVDRMASKGLIHKNKAARQKSRLNKHIRALQG
ncbi:MAG: 30S ribosomal protein S20 [Nitrococcus mobilis]|nr:30S ribosomal protein S20 [Nitrococcus mobilis]